MTPLTIDTRQAELERLGFEMVHSDDTSLLALRQRWHFDLMTKAAILVWVQRVDHLDLDRLKADHDALRAHFATHDPSPSWPVGFGRARALFLVYLTDEASPEALAKAAAAPNPEFAAFLFPVVVTPDDAVWHDRTPLMGAIFYPLLHWFAKRLAHPDDKAPEEPESTAGKVLIGMNVVLLVFVVIMMVFLVGMMALMLGFFALSMLATLFLSVVGMLV